MRSAPREILELVRSVRENPSSGFYRELWRGQERFESLPVVSRTDFIRVPLSKRRYKNAMGMVKIVGAGEYAFLSESSFEDLAAEALAPHSRRPMVYMSDPYEAIEKAMWCYEHGMTPLIGEKDPELAMYAAGRYRIDSLITDQEAIMKFGRFFQTLSRPLDSITVIGSAFAPRALMPFSQHTSTFRLVLSLPETGPFAQATLSEHPVFSALDHAFIEHDGGVILTKNAGYPTPIIRYRTGVASDLF